MAMLVPFALAAVSTLAFAAAGATFAASPVGSVIANPVSIGVNIPGSPGFLATGLVIVADAVLVVVDKFPVSLRLSRLLRIGALPARILGHHLACEHHGQSRGQNKC